jgi:hypothetical protein
MSEQEKAAELARLRDHLAELESGVLPSRSRSGATPSNEREIARIRGRIAELEADLGI